MIKISKMYNIDLGENLAMLELFKKMNNEYSFLITEGLDVTQVDDLKVSVSEGTIIAIDRKLSIVKSTSDMLNLLDLYNYDSVFSDGYYLLVVEHSTTMFSYNIVNVNEFSKPMDAYNKYAILKIIQITSNQITDLLDTFNGFNVTRIGSGYGSGGSGGSLPHIIDCGTSEDV